MIAAATRPTLRLTARGEPVPEPRRIESEPLAIHEARLAAIKRLGHKWLRHPSYRFDPRHSNDREIYESARAAYLAQVAMAAAASRESNPAFIRAQSIRAVLETQK
ncbi:MAG: hypothetical protein KGI71_03985 [Patescibacteria group bacterium]|nr:hypothetical protein [Patescibacteria group bacterium]